MKIQIDSYKDYIEYVKCIDKIINKYENKKLLKARQLAESYYKRGESETAKLILQIASKLFIQNKIQRTQKEEYGI